MTVRFILVLACMLFSQAAEAQTKIYNAQTATLANGMEIVVVPVRRTPAVTHMVWYKAGAGEEVTGTSGTAHFLEHLMFKGTPQVPSGAFSERIQRMGGNDNAFTSNDYTAYFQTVPKERLVDVMRMESERMNDITPSVEDVFSEKLVVKEERRQTTESDPSALLVERMRQALFPNHPYGRPVIGWMPEMQSLKWVDALAFYKQWYAPNNAILVVSGDTSLEEVLPLAQETYGRLPRESVPMRTRPAIPSLDGQVLVTLARPDVREPQWMRLIRVPSLRQNAKASLQLLLLEDLLSGASGRLYRELVVTKKIATAIDVSYSPYSFDDTVFAIYATPAQGVSLEKTGAAIDALLKDIAAKGFDAAEVEKSITRVQDSAVYALDSLAGPAMNIGFALSTGARLEDVETWPQQLETLTPEDARNALADLVMTGPSVTGWLKPSVVSDAGKSMEKAP